MYDLNDQDSQFRVLKEDILINIIFNNLKPEKQKTIVNASIKEFVKSGFDKASTNEIVKQAHISKGTLISYSTQILEDMYEEIDLSETDLFNRIENIGLQKLYVQQKYPEIFDFLKSTIEEESPEVKATIEQHVARIYEDGRQKIYIGID